MQRNIPFCKSTDKIMETGARIAELTARKLELEIREIERPFFRKASFLSLSIPILAALVTGLIGYFGNIEIQSLNEEKIRLVETTRQLVTDQQDLSSRYITSIEDYLAYLGLLEKYKDNPSALFAESGLTDAKQKIDAWLISQKESVLLSKQYAEKYRDLLGTEKTQEAITKSNNIIVLIERTRKLTDETFEDAIRDLRNQ